MFALDPDAPLRSPATPPSSSYAAAPKTQSPGGEKAVIAHLDNRIATCRWRGSTRSPTRQVCFQPPDDTWRSFVRIIVNGGPAKH
jgi:hypothetical protein